MSSTPDASIKDQPTAGMEPRFGFWPYIVPFVAFMLLKMLEPSFPTADRDILTNRDTVQQVGNADQSSETNEADLYVLKRRGELTQRFFLIYGINVLVTTGLLLYFLPTYLRQFPVSATWLSVMVGVVGIVLWVVLCQLGIERWLMDLFSTESTGGRSHFNPFDQLPERWQLVGFLAIRFFGLVIMVPICEELFLRGFLMRYVESTEWWQVRLKMLGWRALLVAPIYGMLTHPVEALAAIAWFSLVTWLVSRTGKFWDAVIAHAVTNLLLGIYVCVYGQWQLW